MQKNLFEFLLQKIWLFGYLQKKIIRKLTSHSLVTYDILCTFLIEFNIKGALFRVNTADKIVPHLQSSSYLKWPTKFKYCADAKYPLS